MSAAQFAPLSDRGFVSIIGDDARSWLDNLVTNDLAGLDRTSAVFAALLSPQGKLLFEFFVVATPGGLLLETGRDQVAGLIKRLGLYKLRAKIAISDASAAKQAVWAPRASPDEPEPPPSDALTFADPRCPAGLWRGVRPTAVEASSSPTHDYTARRVALGVAEAPFDYALGDTFPHEANFDLVDGVSFSKGCYIGQEVVSRMQNRSVVRKRVVRVIGQTPLTSGTEVTVGEAVIGRVGSVAGNAALAMLRLDRVVEALAKNLPITSNHAAIVADAVALSRYRQSVADRPVNDL